ncbi:MAG: hypothetical protein EAY75_15775 [Bacteroidetes bacterium]|nr:MAG: hypothetical protein EAY75_15775 [Bacteroidota bacterium]
MLKHLPFTLLWMLCLGSMAMAQTLDAVVPETGAKDMAERYAAEAELPVLATASTLPKTLQKQLAGLNRQATTLRHTQSNGKMNVIAGYGAQGKLVFKMTTKSNGVEADFTSYYPNGKRMDSGRLAYGKPDGLWKTWYASGALRSTTAYDAQKWQAVSQELRRANPKSSFHSHALPSSLASNAGFARHTRTAPAADGYLPPFTTALAHGAAYNYHPNGELSDSTTYSYGLRNGLWTEWYANGQKKRQGTYLKGQKWGGWSSYSPNGELAKLEEYKADELLHQKQYGRQK